MKLLNNILNKISSKKFNQVYTSLGALSLIATALSKDEDVLNSFCVLAFDEVPNKNFTLGEYINKKADASNKLNLVERHLIAKGVTKYLKDANAYYDAELQSFVNTKANFVQTEPSRIIKSANFGDVALIDNRYHLINPITKNVTAEYIVSATEENFAKLHELIAKYREEKGVKLTELDGQLVLTGDPEVINELEHLVKDTGYYCEAVDESTGIDGEIPEYSLRIFTDLKQASVETTADPDKTLPRTFGYEPIFSDKNLKVEVHVNETTENGKPAGDYSFFDPTTNKVIAIQEILVNNDGYALGEVKFFDGDTNKPLPSTLENNEPTYSKFGIGEDVWAEAIKTVHNDFDKRYEEASPTQDTSMMDVEKIDATNPNLEKDNPMLKPEDVTEEVVEKTTSKDTEVVKTADDNNVDDKAQAVKQFSGEDAKLTQYTTFGLPTYESNGQEFAVSSSEEETHSAVVEEVKSILMDAGYDSFNWDNMGGIENYIDTEWFDTVREESNISYAEDIYSESVERFKEEAKEYGLDIDSPKYQLDNQDADHTVAFEDFSLAMIDADKQNSIDWFIGNYGKDELNKLVNDGKINFDVNKIADEVIRLDGAGHVLSVYDGDEIEQTVNGKTYFLYRQAKKYPSFITVDASKKGEVTVLSGDRLVKKCKTVKAAFESGEVLVDDGSGFVVTYSEDGVGDEDGVFLTLESKGDTVLPFCFSYVFVDDLLKGVSSVDFQKDFNYNKELCKKYGLTEEDVTRYQKLATEELKKLYGDQNSSLQEQNTLEDKKAEEIDFNKELMEAGESKGEKDKVNKEQLEMGKEVEKEHTTNPEIAEKITRDHLAEIPDYYTHLKEMEDNAKKNDAVKSSYAPSMTVDATKTEVTKTAEDVEDNVWVVEKTSAPTIDDQLTLDIFYVVNKNTHVVAHDPGFQPFLFPTQEDAQKYADKLNSQKEDSDVESAKKENIEKKADEELKQFDMKQELDGQKEFEKQDDFSQVSVPEEKEDTSEVTETMEAKPEETKGDSFSASEFGNNLAYIQQNNPDSFSKIMNNLKQIMVGDEKNIYDFLENWSKNNFQDFTAMTREDHTYARHSQYQEQLKNNVLPKLKEMPEYKSAMEEKVRAEKGN